MTTRSGTAKYPIPHEHLLNLPPAEQIAGQLGGLTDMFRRQLEQLDPRQIVHVTYRQLCADPRGTLARIRRAVADWTGDEIALRNEPPAQFPLSRHERVDADQTALTAALEKFGLAPRRDD